MDTLLQRLLLAQVFLCLSYSAPLGATVLLNIYFMLNRSKCNISLQKATSGDSQGMYSALSLRERLPSHKLPVT